MSTIAYNKWLSLLLTHIPTVSLSQFHPILSDVGVCDYSLKHNDRTGHISSVTKCVTLFGEGCSWPGTKGKRKTNH